MLGTGIKNGILLVLIILILHFLIKNMLIEHQGAPAKTLLSKLRDEAIENLSEKHDVAPVEPESNQHQQQDLYKYVMDEGNMETFFEPELLPEANDKFDPSYPVACDATQIMDKQNTESLHKKPKQPTQQSNNFLVIHDYQDESPLNGGGGFDHLSGYDEYDTFYQDYACPT